MIKLYRFDYSPYARKVQKVLDLLQLPYQVIDVPYGDRNELATLTGGYIQVPVLVTDKGKVVVDSRAICEELLQGAHAEKLTPSPWQGPIWAYTDWCDNLLEDVLFRIASPMIRHRFSSPSDQGFYVFIKERKFGKGCVEDWAKNRATLIKKAQEMLTPSFKTLRQRPFLFGDAPTLADAALYGEYVMLKTADAELCNEISPDFEKWAVRLETKG